MIFHSFSGRSIMSMCLTPNSLSASTAADTMQGVDPRVPASPTSMDAVDRMRETGDRKGVAEELNRQRELVRSQRSTRSRGGKPQP